MTRVHWQVRRWRGLGVIIAAASIWMLAATSCGGPQGEAGVGEECYRADDCEEGLVCIAGVCSTDLNSIVSTIDGPAGDTAAAGGAAGTPATGGAAGVPAGGATGGGGAPTGGGGAPTGGGGAPTGGGGAPTGGGGAPTGGGGAPTGGGGAPTGGSAGVASGGVAGG